MAIVEKSPIPESRLFFAKRLIANAFDPNWHFHPEYQLFIVLKGSGTRFIGDHVSDFSVGDLVLTGPNLPHLWRSDPIYFEEKKSEATDGIVVYFTQATSPIIVSCKTVKLESSFLVALNIFMVFI